MGHLTKKATQWVEEEGRIGKQRTNETRMQEN